MFILVQLLNGFNKPLIYKVPFSLQENVTIGSIVQVPLKNKNVSAFVLNTCLNAPPKNIALRFIKEIENIPNDNYFFPFVQQVARYYHCPESIFIKRIRQFLQKKSTYKQNKTIIRSVNTLMLTDEQQRIVDYINPFIIKNKYAPTVIHGVTGSGKTEVYNRILLMTYEHKKTSLFLLPEVSLARQFTHILQEKLPSSLCVYSFHSGTSISEKKALWQSLLNKTPLVIVGVHLPLFLPISNLGIIIVDEEHEIGYQEKKHPKINTHDAAILRAHVYNIPIILGSATPSIQTLFNIEKRNWKLFCLTKRFSGSFPVLKHIHMNKQTARKNFWISNTLHNEIQKRLDCNQQTILFLNRRGVSFFIQCKTCTYLFSCSYCAVSLTLHMHNRLYCHYCGYTKTAPQNCPSCKNTTFLKKGIGTQQLVTIIQKLFPHAKIGRADLDVSSKPKLWKQLITNFEQQKLDILIGTQSITKGFHFPQVTLVGIIWADLQLNVPTYNAHETTLQQLIQVAGRAGRYHPNSTVVMQYMQQHPLFAYIDEQKYMHFYKNERIQRFDVGYPPAIRLAEIECRHHQEALVKKEAQEIASFLMKSDELIVLGPIQPPIAKIKRVYYQKIYLKAESFTIINKAYKSIDQQHYKSSLFFTPNPLSQ